MRNTTPTNRNIIFDDATYNKVASNIAYTLRKNAGAWITEEEILDITGAAFLHIAEVMEGYDPEKGANFQTWANTVGVRFAISEGMKCSNRQKRFSSLDASFKPAESEVENGWGGFEDESADEYGIQGMYGSETSLSLEQAEEAQLWEKRSEWFSNKARTSLCRQDQELFGMMLDGLSKDQMIARTGRSSNSIDTARCRLRAKLRSFDREWDGYARKNGLV